jgi:glycosyltransferase involved in cell wall biosynthesis
MIILTTSYNCEKFVEKSLLSIMGQRFKDFTCYITDDLSTDNTVEIIKKTIQAKKRNRRGNKNRNKSSDFSPIYKIKISTNKAYAKIKKAK